MAAGETTPIDGWSTADRLGYERTTQVEERGELAVRGGLIDVYPSTADLPIRIEFFGDEIESVRAFSPFTQRTIQPVERALIWPAVEPEAHADRIGPYADPHLRPLVSCAWRPTNIRARCVRRASGSPTRPPPARWSIPMRWSMNSRPRRGSTSRRRRRPKRPSSRPGRFATRGQAEAEGELARLARNGNRVLVTFVRRGDMERAALRAERISPVILAPESSRSPAPSGSRRSPFVRA